MADATSDTEATATTDEETEGQAGTESATDDGGDSGIDQDVQTNTVEYWKQRSRQNEKGSRRLEKLLEESGVEDVDGLRDLLKERKNADEGGEPSAAEIRREAEQAAEVKANARIVRSEIRAAAAKKLADPKDALRYLDINQFEVDKNGEVDSEEVGDAIDDLIKERPYLAAATAKRFQGTGDGGAARNAGGAKQVTEAELKTMTPDQIVKAQTEGRLKNLLGAG